MGKSQVSCFLTHSVVLECCKNTVFVIISLYIFVLLFFAKHDLLFVGLNVFYFLFRIIIAMIRLVLEVNIRIQTGRHRGTQASDRFVTWATIVGLGSSQCPLAGWGLRRRKLWKFDYELVHSQVLKNALFACFRFFIFHPFFQGVSWPHLPLCANVHGCSVKSKSCRHLATKF